MNKNQLITSIHQLLSNRKHNPGHIDISECAIPLPECTVRNCQLHTSWGGKHINHIFHHSSPSGVAITNHKEQVVDAALLKFSTLVHIHRVISNQYV